MPTPLRILSLLPSATEVVCALGLRDALVGRSHECDYPPGVEELPFCTEPKIDVHGSSHEIHQQIEKLLGASLSVYRVDAAKLRDLQPTHIVTQVQCEVCAVSLGDVEAALADWADSRPRIVALNPRSLEDCFSDIERAASALGTPSRGASLVGALRQRMSAISKRTRSVLVRPRVTSIEWLSPLMAAGNWIPQLVEMAGGESLFGEPGQHSPWLDWDALLAGDPDLIFLFPCGFSLPRIREEIPLLAADPRWRKLRAVREGRVFLCDGNQYFNRPGPRLVESLEIMAEILHPEIFRFGHEGSGWERLRQARE
ncbi:MAG: cobalamin-binding protein [Thermoanaerobaculia bacterium]